MSHLIKLYKSVKCLIVAFLCPQYLYHLYKVTIIVLAHSCFDHALLVC